MSDILVAGKWRTERKLGQGAFGEIYKGKANPLTRIKPTKSINQQLMFNLNGIL